MAPSQLLTRLDLSDTENVKDAQAELRRAGNDPAKLAVWAGKWGDALCMRALEAEGALIDAEAVSALEEDIRTEEGRSKDLTQAVRGAASAIDKLLEHEGDALAAKHFTMISKIGDDLEAVL